MDRILLLGGNTLANNKIIELDFKVLNYPNSKSLFISPFAKTNYLIYQNSKHVLNSILASNIITKRREYFFIYNLARNVHKNYSMRIRARHILGLHFRPKNINGAKKFLRLYLQVSVWQLLFFFVLGLFRFPKLILLKLLKFRLDELQVFEQLIIKEKIAKIVIFSAGTDNFSFLVNFMKSKNDFKKLMLILNWDNPSSKAIISERFDCIATWNDEQILHIKNFSSIELLSKSTIGSRVADVAYKKYFNSISSSPKDTKLLFLGQQNRCDEIMELKSIKKITQQQGIYSRLVYRPNPFRKDEIDERELHELGISLDLKSDINLREYAGIVLFPTTMILEVMLSGVPAVVYTPKHSDWLFDPYNCWNYLHFLGVKEILNIPHVSEFTKLAKILEFGLPEPNKFSQEKFNRIFPRFELDFETRLLNFINSV